MGTIRNLFGIDPAEVRERIRNGTLKTVVGALHRIPVAEFNRSGGPGNWRLRGLTLEESRSAQPFRQSA